MSSRLLVFVLFGFGSILTATSDGSSHPHPDHGDQPEAERTNLRVMSFNIRYDNPRDGEDAWPKRKELVAETIRKFQPDLLGTQEVLKHQGDYLRGALREYRFHGVGRDDGEEAGEFCGVFYRTDRFTRLKAGHFWLSETPDEPGSRGWDAACSRIVSWVKLKDRRTDEVFYFLNTHFDHRGKTAREESAKALRKFISETAGDEPVVLAGDFNCGENTKPYNTLTKSSDATIPALQDSYRTYSPKPGEHEATFGGFKGATRGGRIDWILHSRAFEPIDAWIDRSEKDGRYPSDHYPVCAILKWAEADAGEDENKSKHTDDSP